jgi:hypothetical protein
MAESSVDSNAMSEILAHIDGWYLEKEAEGSSDYVEWDCVMATGIHHELVDTEQNR